MQPMTPSHPIEFGVDYPDRQLDRVSTFFRPVFAIPILVVLAVAWLWPEIRKYGRLDGT